MHPMFVNLFIEPDSGDPFPEEDEKLRRSRRTRRSSSPGNTKEHEHERSH